MTIEDKILRRAEMLADIKQQCKQIRNIKRILNNHIDRYQKAKKAYEALDREIFLERPGITIISLNRSGPVKRINQQVLNEAFIDSLTDQAREELMNRLTKRMSQPDQKIFSPDQKN